MRAELMTREAYLEKYERWASQLKKVGVVFLGVFVVLICVSWLLWGIGVAYRPVVHTTLLLSGLILGLAPMCLAASIGWKWGISQIRRRWKGYPKPKRFSSYAVTLCVIGMVVTISCLARVVIMLITFEPSPPSGALGYPGDGFFWFGVDGLIEILASFSAGVFLGATVILAWGVRQAVGWRKQDN